jgi:signal transduction histidine kinase
VFHGAEKGVLVGKQMTFEVHPSVIFKLGEDLITDDYQALVELIKNSYDADATCVTVRISTNKNYAIIDGEISEMGDASQDSLCGSIEIIDNGSGMSLENIEKGWLTISASQKRVMKEQGLKTKGQSRTPLGDKGLGRLGAQRLGRILEMKTRVAGSTALKTVIDWTRFEGDNTLSSIPLDVMEINSLFKNGTILSIYGLKNVSSWENLRIIQDKFADIISPYSEDLGLSVELFINDKELDLREQSKIVLSNSAITYTFDYKDGLLTTHGAIDIRYLTDLRTSENRATWEELIAPDNGKDFFQWLSVKKVDRVEELHFKHNKHGKFCNFCFVVDIDALPSIERDDNNDVFDPGVFTGRIDAIQRHTLTADSEISNVAELLDSIKGVKVYRDGFGIRLKDSIIPFASQWTKGKSYYTLRPENVVGFLNLSAEKNAKLIETTNREEFQENAYYRNFQKLLSAWLNRTEEVQSLLRTGYKDYVKAANFDAAKLDEDLSPEQLAAAIKNKIDKVQKAVKFDGLFHAPEMGEAIDELQAKSNAVGVLADKAQQAEEQLQQSWELIGLGIIAETVSHEMSNIARRLIDHSETIRQYNNKKYKDEKINGHSEQVRSMASTLAKQVSHLDSSLKYVREKRDVFALSDFIANCISYFKERFQRKDIVTEVTVLSNFQVSMNQGRLLQVVDNLIINSEYWLSEALVAGKINQATIRIEIDCPYVYFSDNGLGIDRSIENALFEPFTTRKPKEKGRGLGLFISQQLLSTESAYINLCNERNQWNHRYKFRIDLANVVRN